MYAPCILAAQTASGDALSPVNAPRPQLWQDMFSIFLSAISLLQMPSAIALRQVLPVQTKVIVILSSYQIAAVKRSVKEFDNAFGSPVVHFTEIFYCERSCVGC